MNASSSHEPAALAEGPALRLIRKAIHALNATAVALSALGILAALSLIGWSVIMRYVFNRPPVWVDEVVGFLLVAIVTLACADVLRRGEHIGVDIFTSMLGPKGRRWAHAWGSLAAVLTSLVFVINGWETAMFSRMLGIVTEGNLELPLYWLILFLPLGGLLMLLSALEALLRAVWGAAPVFEHGGEAHGQSHAHAHAHSNSANPSGDAK